MGFEGKASSTEAKESGPKSQNDQPEVHCIAKTTCCLYGGHYSLYGWQYE